MGYRSEVQIVLPYNLVKEISNKIDEKLNKIMDVEKVKDMPYDYNMLRTADSIYTDKNSYCVFKWNYIKFYEDCIDVKALLETLDEYNDEDGNNIYNICEAGEDGAVLREYNDNEDIPSLYAYTSIEIDRDRGELEEEINFEDIV